MSKLEYAPLRFSKHFNLDSIREILNTGFQRMPLQNKVLNTAVLQDIRNLEPKQLLQMVFARDFFTFYYNGPYALLNKGMLQNGPLNAALFEMMEDENCMACDTCND